MVLPRQLLQMEWKEKRKKVPDQPSLSAAQLVGADGMGREESKGPDQPYLSAAVTAGDEPWPLLHIFRAYWLG
jgi:hypothetical protein